MLVMLERSPDATRHLASRGRRRVQDAPRLTGDRVVEIDTVNDPVRLAALGPID